MLASAFALLLSAVLAGGVLMALHLRAARGPGPALGVLHGLLGVAGCIALLLALRGPARGAAMGVGDFGRVAAALVALALVAAVPIVLMRLRRRRVPGLLIGVHATIAVSGVVILAAYTFVG